MIKNSKILDFLGLKKSIAAMLCMVILIGLGEKMAERFLPLYLMALGGGAFSIGLLNGLNNLLVAFAFGLIGTIYFAAFGKDLGTSPQRHKVRFSLI